MAEVGSPCVAVCKLDRDNICIGCRRSLDEIAAWRALDDTQKRAMLALAALRTPRADEPGR